MTKRGFFSDGINVNAEQAEEKLAEYKGVAKPTRGPAAKHPPSSGSRRAIIERTPFQRRLRWVMLRLLKLGAVLGVYFTIAGISFLATSVSLHQGKLEHKVRLKGADVALSVPADGDDIALRVTAEDGTQGIYERKEGGVWTVSLVPEASESGYKEFFSTDRGSIWAYSGREAGKLTIRVVNDDGEVTKYNFTQPREVKTVVGAGTGIPDHDHKLYGLTGRITVFIDDADRLLLDYEAERGSSTYYTIDAERGFSPVTEEEGARLALDLRKWTKRRPRVTLLRFGNMLQVQWRDSDGRLAGHTTLDTHGGIYVDFGIERVDSEAAETGKEGEGKRGAILAELIASSVVIALLLILFRRDFRLLTRYLGKPMRRTKAVLTATGTAVGAKIASGLGTALLVMLAYLLAGRAVAEKLITVPENFRQPMDLVSHDVLGIIAGIAVIPSTEELIFRGVLFLICVRMFGKLGAVLVTTTLFVAMHFITYTMAPVVIVMLSMAGISAVLVLLWTRRVYWCIAFHATFNAIGIAMWSVMT